MTISEGCGRRARRASPGAGYGLALLVVSCGQFSSWEERWMLDGAGHSSSAPSGDPASPAPCEAQPIEGYRYVEPPEQWPGSQEVLDVSVSGVGYLATGADPSERRFLRAAALEVAADGTLVLGDAPVLGYAPEAATGQCLVELRVPAASPARPTTFIDLTANLDSRSPVVTFDVLDSSGTANVSTTFSVFDSAGVSHLLDVYFAHQGNGQVEYHVLADGGDLVAGVPGVSVDLSTATLQFDADGALVEAMTPTVYIPFAGVAAPEQGIVFSWGSRSPWGGSDDGLTYLPMESQVFSQASDGFRPGIAVGIYVGAAGDVVAYYDSAEALPIGTLALARFSRAAQLAPLADGWLPTPESGGPLYGAPLSGGRGALLIAAPSL